MKTVNAYLFGFLGLLVAGLTPLCVLAVIDMMIFGKDHWDHPAGKGSPEFIMMMVLMPALIAFCAWHYVYRYLIPWFARLRILKVGDKRSTEQWLRRVEISLRRVRRDCEALEAYRNDLAEQIGAANAASPRR